MSGLTSIHCFRTSLRHYIGQSRQLFFLKLFMVFLFLPRRKNMRNVQNIRKSFHVNQKVIFDTKCKKLLWALSEAWLDACKSMGAREAFQMAPHQNGTQSNGQTNWLMELKLGLFFSLEEENIRKTNKIASFFHLLSTPFFNIKWILSQWTFSLGYCSSSSSLLVVTIDSFHGIPCIV